MNRHLAVWIVAATVLICLAGPAAAAPKENVKAAEPHPDHVAGLIDKYAQGSERDRFFQAAGVDGELTREEFAEGAKRPDGFVRSYDNWGSAIAHDLDKNGTLNWVEAEKYRLSVRKQVLEKFDKDKDGKLTDKEREAANAWLAKGLRPPGRGYTSWGIDRWDTDGDGKLSEQERKARSEHFRLRTEQWRKKYDLRRYDKNNNGKLDEDELAAKEADRKKTEARMAEWRKRQAERVKKHDADGDGKLNAEERKAMYAAMTAEYRKKRLEQWDADGDGQISEKETQAERAHYRKQAEERYQKWLLKRHDKDGDGELNDQEQAAFDAAVEKRRKQRAEWEKRRQEWVKRWDADGNGSLSDDERKAMSVHYRRQAEERRSQQIKKWDADGDGKLNDEERRTMREAFRARWQERRKQMDTDGDGKVSGEESGAYWKKLREKYDADGNGELNEEERRKMYDAEGYRGWSSYGNWGPVRIRPGGAAGGGGGRAWVPIKTGENETVYVSEQGAATVIIRRSRPEEQ